MTNVLDYINFTCSNNMFLSIASNLSPSTILKHVRNSFFQKISSNNNLSKLIKINHNIEISKNPINLIKKTEFPIIQLLLGFVYVEFNHPDRYILDLIQTAVGENMTGKLKYTLREEKGLVYIQLQLTLNILKDSGVYYLFLKLNIII